MKSRIGTLVGWLLVVIVLMGGLVASLLPAQADGVIPGYVLVHVQPGVDVQKLAQDYNTTVIDGVPATGLYSLKTPPGITETAFAAQLSKDPRLVYADTDTYGATPELNGDPFHMPFDFKPTPTGFVKQFAYQQVNVNVPGTQGNGQVNAGSPGATAGAGVIVAVLDSGATFNHPALAGHYLPGYNAINPTAAPLDLPDGTVNWDVGHGTMVAGIIARLAPGAMILPIRVLNGDGVGSMLNVAKGVHYAVTHGARVINMSFGTAKACGALGDALEEAQAAGAVVVAAAGNDGGSKAQIPASNHLAVAVAAVEANNVKSSYSNYGSYIFVVAPGSNIQSTYWTGGFATWSGTSFSTPFVAAEAALVLWAQPKMTAVQVMNQIRSTAHSVDSVNASYRGQLGQGLIDIQAALGSPAGSSGNGNGSGGGSGNSGGSGGGGSGGGGRGH